MLKNYSSLSSNTTLEFSKKSERKLSEINPRIINTSWFVMILMLLSMTPNKSNAASQPKLVFNSSYTYHTVILKSFVAHGHSGGGGDGYAYFSPTDHDKPIYCQQHITFNKTKQKLQYNNTNKSTNIKTILS